MGRAFSPSPAGSQYLSRWPRLEWVAPLALRTPSRDGGKQKHVKISNLLAKLLPQVSLILVKRSRQLKLLKE